MTKNAQVKHMLKLKVGNRKKLKVKAIYYNVIYTLKVEKNNLLLAFYYLDLYKRFLKEKNISKATIIILYLFKLINTLYWIYDNIVIAVFPLINSILSINSSIIRLYITKKKLCKLIKAKNTN